MDRNALGGGEDAFLDAPSTSAAMAKTTTISTIAVQSGKTRIVIALLHCGNWLQLKILEITPDLTTLGCTLQEALTLQKAHNEVLRQLQSKQSPVEELLRQADQLIVTQRPRAEVYAAMAESLGRAWKDINYNLDIRKHILDLNVHYHVKADEFFGRIEELEQLCTDTNVPIETEAVKMFLTNIHDLRRALLESLMAALQAGNSLLGKLKELGAEGTLDSRPDQIKQSVNRAISQVQGWLDELHIKRQMLEAIFNQRKKQLEECLALAILAADLRNLDEKVHNCREALKNADHLGDSSSSAELILHEHKKLVPEAKDLQERALRITKATEQLLSSSSIASDEATKRSYAVLSATSEYFTDLQNTIAFLDRVINFFRSAQEAFTKLNQIEIQLKTSELARTSPKLIQFHEQCSKTIDSITEAPISEGHQIIYVAGVAKDSEGVKRIVEELENKKIYLDGLCTAHREENKRISVALNHFLEQHNTIYNWLLTIAEAFLQGHQDMGSDLTMADDFLSLHNQLLKDLEAKGAEINSLFLALPSILEHLEDSQRQDIDNKVEELHNRWMKIKNILEDRLSLGAIYVKFHKEADLVNKEIDKLENLIAEKQGDIDDDTLKTLERKWESLEPLYQSAKNTGLTFVHQCQKISEPHLDTKRACVSVESVLDKLAGRQLHVTKNWQSFHLNIVETRELLEKLEETMTESTRTINWVTKLEAQLYPVITTELTVPREICEFLQKKLELVMQDVKRAQEEVDQKIKSTEFIISKTPKEDARVKSMRDKLSELKNKLNTVVADYQVLLQVLISYFNNLEKLDESIRNLGNQFDNIQLAQNIQNIQQIINEHEASKLAIMEMFRFAQNEYEQLVQRILRQEPEEAAKHDISKLKFILESRKSAWETQCKQRSEYLGNHSKLYEFNKDLKEIEESLSNIERKLNESKGQYGYSLNEAKLTLASYTVFENTINDLEPRIQDFIRTGEDLLAQQPQSSPYIQKAINKLGDRWNALKASIENNKKLIELSIQYFGHIGEADEWFKEGSRLLFSIARKSTSVKTPGEAQQLLNDIEIFLKPGEEVQNKRLQTIASLAEQIYGPNKTEGHTHIIKENKEMLESFSNISRDLNALCSGLERQKEEQARRQKEQDEANAKLLAAREETLAAEAAAARALEEKKAMEEAARALEEANAAKQHQLQLEELERKEREEKLKQEELNKEALRLEELKREEIRKEELKREEIRIEELKVKHLAELSRPVQHPPVFTSPLSDAVIQEGCRFTFICQVTGSPVPKVTWYKGGVSIQNNPDYLTTYESGLCTLTIDETFAEDSAKYSCKAENDAGVADTYAYLKVKESELENQMIPPTFAKVLEPASVREESTFSFECTVEGNPLPTVQWLKNNECIDNSPDYLITYNNGEAKLKFEKVSLLDKGIYTCKASNELGMAETTANLAVTPLIPMQPPHFVTPLSNIMARAGQKIKLECEVSGLPLPTLTWTNNNNIIRETREVKLQREGDKATLIIFEAFPKDAGTYLVTAENKAGKATSSCSVLVKGRLPTETSDSELASDMEPIKPSIQLPLTNLCINESNRVRLDCVIVGQPEPEVIWYHDGRPVKESQDYQLLFQGDRCSLIIQGALVEDAGEYKVVALNSAGEASSKCNLTVTATDSGKLPTQEEPIGSPPKFNKLLADVLVSEGEKVTFEGLVTGNPKPDIKWLLNNIPFDNTQHKKIIQEDDGTIRLIIENALPEDKGVYTVKASNSSGEAKCFAQLIVKSLRTPEVPKQEEVKIPPTFKELFHDKTAFEETSTKFECIVAGKPSPKVRWLFNGGPISVKNILVSTSGDRQVLSIPDIKAEHEGTITCVAENEAGTASCAAKLYVQKSDSITLSEIPSSELALQQQKTDESTYSFKKEIHSESSTMSSSKIISSSIGAPEPQVQTHSFSAQKEQTFKQTNGQAPDITETHKSQEKYQFGQEAPIINEMSSSVVISGSQKSEVQQPVQKSISYSSMIKARPPKFVTPVIGKIVDQKVDVVLEGILDGQPTPKVSWTKNGAPLTPNDKTTIKWELNKATVELKNVSIADAGRYTCTATNEAGTAVSTADLVVRKTVFPPVFGRRLQAQVIKKGDKIIMEVEITGTPEPTVSWFKNDVPIDKSNYRCKSMGNSHTMIIDKADLKDSGRFMVKATNEGGEAQSIADIAVFEPTPDTMVEVVKTVVFEDLQKHETLTSAVDKLSLGQPKPIVQEITKPIEMSKDHTEIFQSSAQKSEFSSFSEQKMSQETKSFKLEHKMADIPAPAPIIKPTFLQSTPTPIIDPTFLEQKRDFEIIHPIEQTIIKDETKSEEATIETSSITKESSLQYFMKKIKEQEEPILPPTKEIVHIPLKTDTYKKFEATPKPAPAQPFVTDYKIESYSTTIPDETRYESRSYNKEIVQEFNIQPEPPAEICFQAGAPSTYKKFEETLKPSLPISKIIDHKVESYSTTIPHEEKYVSSSFSKEIIKQELPRPTAPQTKIVDHKIESFSSTIPHEEKYESRSFNKEVIRQEIPKPSVLPTKIIDHKIESFSSTIPHETRYESCSFNKEIVQEFNLQPEPPAQIFYEPVQPKPAPVKPQEIKKTPPPPPPKPIKRLDQIQPFVPQPPVMITESKTESSSQFSQKFESSSSSRSFSSERTARPHSTIGFLQPTKQITEQKWTQKDLLPSYKDTQISTTKYLSKEAPELRYYVGNVSHLEHIRNPPPQESSFSKMETFESSSKSEQFQSSYEKYHQEHSGKPHFDVKPYAPPLIFKKEQPPSMDKLLIRPVSVQDITDEVFLEPGPPPEMAYAQPPTERRQSYVERREKDLQKNLEKGPAKVPPGGVRTIPPPPLPPKKEQPLAPPIPAKPTFKPVERITPVSKPIEIFPELEPFPFKPDPEKPKPVRVGPPPTPSKFIKGKFTDSDYESDFEAVRIPPKWRPCSSDTEESGYKRVHAPHGVLSSRSRSTEPEPLPPSKFEQPPTFVGPPRPTIDIEEQRLKHKTKHMQKIVRPAEIRHPAPAPQPPLQIKPGSPPIFMEAQRKQEIKQKKVADGYMADTDEPFAYKKMMKTEMKEEKSFKQISQSYERSENICQKFEVAKAPPVQKFTHHKKHEKEFVSTPIVTNVRTEQSAEFQKQERIKPKKVLPPPPSPSKFVKGEFRESDYESDYDSRIPPMWTPKETRESYKPVQQPITPVLKAPQSFESTKSSQFIQSSQIESVPKFKPIEKPQFVSKQLEHFQKQSQKSQIVKPKPVTAAPSAEIIRYMPEPGSPPEIGYAPPQTQYYKSKVSTPYQTETSNVMHINESTENCHRTISLQQTTKIIKFDDKYKNTQSKIVEVPQQRVPAPIFPKKFTPGQYHESDYESEMETTKIKSKWLPEGTSYESKYKKVAPPSVRSSSVPPQDNYYSSKFSSDTVDSTQMVKSSQFYSRARSQEPKEIVIQPGTPPEYVYSNQSIKKAASEHASKHMSSMTQAFKSKTQEFVKDIMQDVKKSKDDKLIQKKSKEDGDAQVYREESRASTYGTKHVDPDTGLIYFKYDFGYEFGILFPGESKEVQIPVPQKTVLDPPKRYSDIEMPVYHETTKPSSNIKPSKFSPKTKNVKWEPTSESELSEYEAEGRRQRISNYQGSRWDPSSCSPVSLSPSIPSTSPAFPNYAGTDRGMQTPPSCPSTPGNVSCKTPTNVQPRAPFFITPLRNIAVICGQSAKFECIVQSEPMPNVIWSKNGRILQNSHDYQIHFRNGVCRLTISRAYPEDAATYGCTATNSAGTTTTTAILEVPGERKSTFIK